MPDFDAGRREALALLADARSAVYRRFGQAQVLEVEAARTSLLEGRLTAVAVGEFKRGKSSLLGALLEEPELFPVDVDIATSLVTSVEYGAAEQILAYHGDGASVAPTMLERDQLADHVTEGGNPGNARNVSLVRITIPSPRLETGLVILDTPGAGGVNTAHTAVTYAVLSSADVAIFVLDALTPLTTQELALLTDVARQAGRLLVVITKIDLVADHEVAVGNARSKISAVLGDDFAARTPVIPVSSAAKLDWMRTRDPESLEVSNFASLENQLWSMLTERGGALLIARSLGRLIRLLDDLAAPLDAEILALTASAERLESRTAGVNRRSNELADLAQPAAGWRRQLVDAFDGVRTAISSRLDADLAAVAERLEQRLTAPGVLDDAQRLLADLQRDVVLAWSAAVRDVRRRLAELSDTVETTTGLRPNPVLPREGALTAFESFGRTNRGDAEAPGAGFAALEWLGEVLAFVMGDVSVYIVTRLATFFGVRVARAQRRRAQYVEDVRDQFARAQRELHERLIELLASAEDSLTTTFNSAIEADRRRLATVKGALESGGGDSGRVAEVSAALTELTSLRDRAHAIVQRVSATEGAVSAA